MPGTQQALKGVTVGRSLKTHRHLGKGMSGFAAGIAVPLGLDSRVSGYRVGSWRSGPTRVTGRERPKLWMAGMAQKGPASKDWFPKPLGPSSEVVQVPANVSRRDAMGCRVEARLACGHVALPSSATRHLRCGRLSRGNMQQTTWCHEFSAGTGPERAHLRRQLAS